MSLSRIAASLRNGEFSPTEIVGSYLNLIEENKDLNAYLSVRGQEAMDEAKALENSDVRGELWGVPIAVKDIIDVAGAPTTAASKLLESNVATTDAHVVQQLKAAGAVILGKLNTHEFAYGAMTTSPHFGPARNPWSRERICGGSSGGSASAVAAGLAAGTLGTDTAGSVRLPSALCGITGLRPTTGRVSNRGTLPVAWSFDTVGPMATSAQDCALMLNVIAGRDAQDPTTLDVPVPNYVSALSQGVKGLRIGVVRTLFESGINPAISQSVAQAIQQLISLGARVKEVEIALFDSFGTIQQAMQFPEAAAVHLHNLRTRLDEYSPDVRARLLVGLFLPPTAYVTGQRARRVAVTQMNRILRISICWPLRRCPLLPHPLARK